MTEVIVVVAVMGVLAAAAVAMVASGAIQGAREVRATQDQKVLNSAVLAYLSSGGALTGAENAGEVLAKLRTSATPEQRRRIPGLSGSFLDPSVEFVVQTTEEAEKESLRLHWNPATNRFDVARSGTPGIVSVAKRGGAEKDPKSGQEGHGENAQPSEAHEHRLTPFAYADKSTWVWDYADAPLTFPSGPSVFAVADPTDIAPSPVPPTTSPAKRDVLEAPDFSLPGGRYPRHDFDLALAFKDRNPVGTAKLFYSVNYGHWQSYGGGLLSVPPGSSIKAQAIALDTGRWESSSVAEELYHAFYSMLLPPRIDFDEPYFQNSKSKVVNSITVTLTDTNPGGLSSVLYQLGPIPRGIGPTTEFRLYDGTFSVSSSDYPQGFGVRAFASAALAGYEDSRISSRFATERNDLFGGHLDLDTSTFIAEVGAGKTDAHSHDVLKSVGGTSIDFFALPESKQIEIQEAVTNPAQRFRLLVVNGNLSPGMNIVLNYEMNGTPYTLDMPMDRYGTFSDGGPAVFSLGGGTGTARLLGLRIAMAQDVIFEAGVIPTNTGDVVGNVLGKGGEWRNGSLTLQAVRVNDDGSAGYTLDPKLSAGGPGVATSGLLWEAALFWHWDGESYHREKNTFVPRNFNSIRLFVKD